MSAEAIRHAPEAMPILWAVDSPDLGALERHEALFDDFLRMSYATPELDARLRRLRRAAGSGPSWARSTGG